jgi:hypothetical protein
MKTSKLGFNYTICKDECGRVAINVYRLPKNLGVALFNLEVSPHTKHTLDSIHRQFKTISSQEIATLHTAVRNIIRKYSEA